MRRLLALAALSLVAVACDPLGIEDPTTTTTSTTTTTTTTTTVPPSELVEVTTAEELNEALEPGGHVRVVESITTDAPIVLPDDFTLEFAPGKGIARTADAVGAAIDISSRNVTVRDAAVLGTNPCYWTNRNPYNPAAVGEQYAQWSAEKDSAGIRLEEHAAVYIRPGAQNVTIDGLVAHDLWGDGVTVSGGADIALFGIAVRCAGRSGLSITEGENVRVAGGMFSGQFWWGINVEPFGQKQVDGVTVTNLTVGYTRYPWLQVGFGEGANCQVRDVNAQDVTLLPESSRPSRVQSCLAGQVTRPPGDRP